MRQLSALTCFMLISACAPGTSLDGEERDLFVAAHNEVRAAATPAPDPALPPLQFDAELASIAQQWANGCKFEHSTNGLGENLAVLFGTDGSPDDIVDLWASEDAFYDYDANNCAQGEQCGHYTQIVWRGTQRVGCGVASCGNVQGVSGAEGATGQLWVCNYDPPGNVIGERPY